MPHFSGGGETLIRGKDVDLTVITGGLNEFDADLYEAIQGGLFQLKGPFDGPQARQFFYKGVIIFRWHLGNDGLRLTSQLVIFRGYVSPIDLLNGGHNSGEPLIEWVGLRFVFLPWDPPFSNGRFILILFP